MSIKERLVPRAGRLFTICLATALLAGAGALDARSAGPGPTPDELCAGIRAGEKCHPGMGQRLIACATCVSHKGWPRITGVKWQVVEDGIGVHAFLGGSDNDELLGRHGTDVLFGQGGDDVIWGDSQPVGNRLGQLDFLRGGAGNDWIFASHGYNAIQGNAGNDHISAIYGHGTIDCGPGRDKLTVAHNKHYSIRRCEKILR